MKLIADSGSTKTNWCLIDNGKPVSYFDTEGFNPYYVNSDYITAAIQSKLPATIAANQISGVSYYGAGCGGDKNHVVEQALKNIFTTATFTIDSDLLAAARAVLGHSAGFVAILGTGTNSCIYNGEKITHQVDSLGFMLGDEGSGAYIGKKLLIDYGRDLMPADIKQEFWILIPLLPKILLIPFTPNQCPTGFVPAFASLLYRAFSILI
jgi:glucosamine kinase